MGIESAIPAFSVHVLSTCPVIRLLIITLTVEINTRLCALPYFNCASVAKQSNRSPNSFSTEIDFPNKLIGEQSF